jgi:hypothetical protein
MRMLWPWETYKFFSVLKSEKHHSILFKLVFLTWMQGVQLEIHSCQLFSCLLRCKELKSSRNLSPTLVNLHLVNERTWSFQLDEGHLRQMHLFHTFLLVSCCVSAWVSISPSVQSWCFLFLGKVWSLINFHPKLCLYYCFLRMQSVTFGTSLGSKDSRW